MRSSFRGPAIGVSVLRVGLLLALLGLGLAITPALVGASTLTVTTTADSGAGSLRATIAAANAGDTVVVPVSGSHYMVTSAEIQITKALIIQGAGPTKSVIDAAGHNRVFEVTSTATSATFKGVTITGGSANTTPGGGGILVDAGVTGTVALVNAAVNGNAVNVSTAGCCAGGGGVYNDGSGATTLAGTSVDSNTVIVTSTGGCCQGGGGVYTNNGDVSLSTKSQVSKNTLTVNAPAADSGSFPGLFGSGGGGVYQNSGTVTITDSTLSGNSATVNSGDCCHGGGAVYGNGRAIIVSEKSVLSNNTATVNAPAADGANSHCCSGGGAINQDGAANTTISHSTLSGNSASVNGSDCCQGGGAILVGDKTHTLTIGGSTFNTNTATVKGPSGDVVGPTGTNDHCCSGGGAVLAYGGLAIDTSTFHGNSAGVTAGNCCHGGGAILSQKKSQLAKITKSALTGNTFTVTGPSSDTGKASSHCCHGGGAIDSYGAFDIADSTISDNRASVTAGDCCHGGGAIASFDVLTLLRDSISGNVLNMNGTGCCNGGGAIQFDATLGMSVAQTLVSGNKANFTSPDNCCNGGGAIYEDSGGSTYVNTTITGNTTDISNGGHPDYGGGGIYALIGHTPDVFANVTLAGNTAPTSGGGGIVCQCDGVQAMNSIFALNTAQTGANCFVTPGSSGTFSSHGYNIENQPQTCGFTATGDQLVPAAQVGLGPLANNGGPTQALALQLGSHAIDAGNPAGCRDANGQPLKIDQRGGVRPQGPHCDVGAFELRAVKPSVTTGSASKVTSTSATVSGSLAPNDLTTTVHFEWGPTTKYGHSTKGKAIGAGVTSRSFSALLSGLPHGTTIHYRAVGTNSLGTVGGKDRTLVTK